MSRRFFIVAEDRQSYLLATTLCDRVIGERSSATWLRELWEAGEEMQRALRVWSKLDPSGASEWTTRSEIKTLAQKRSISIHALGMTAEGAFAYKAAKLALMSPEGGDAGALFLVRDSDGDTGVGENVRGGARMALKTPERLTVIAAVPHPEAEAWVAAGIVPAGPEEDAKHKEERRRLGFDPITAPHLLTSGKSTDKRDAKGACKAILGGAFKDVPERWRRCWEETDLTTLEKNGAEAGLREYTREVEARILPLLTGRAPSA